MQRHAGVLTYWSLLVAEFDAKGLIPLRDGHGREVFADRADLRDIVASGIAVYPVSGQRLTIADVDAGRLL